MRIRQFCQHIPCVGMPLIPRHLQPPKSFIEIFFNPVPIEIFLPQIELGILISESFRFESEAIEVVEGTGHTEGYDTGSEVAHCKAEVFL